MEDYERRLIHANDERSMRSRVFVGNLNTLHVSREDLKRRFGRYGRPKAVVVFKGFAFIQFEDEETARLAASREDQQLIGGQKVDCNLATEPKPNQRGVGRKFRTFKTTVYRPRRSTSPLQSPARSPALSPVRLLARSPPIRSYVRSPARSSARSPVRSHVPPARSPVRPYVVSPARSPDRSPVRPYVRSPARSPVRPYVRSPVRSPVRAHVRSPVRSPVRPYVRSPVYSPVRLYVRSPARSPFRSHAQSPARSHVLSPAQSLKRSASRSRVDATFAKTAFHTGHDDTAVATGLSNSGTLGPAKDSAAVPVTSRFCQSDNVPSFRSNMAHNKPALKRIKLSHAEVEEAEVEQEEKAIESESINGPANPATRQNLDEPADVKKKSVAKHDTGLKDMLVCGSCRTVFASLVRFVEHKRSGCAPHLCINCSRDINQLRCATLLCASPGCDTQCDSAWDLLRHHEADHGALLHRLARRSQAQIPGSERPHKHRNLKKSEKDSNRKSASSRKLLRAAASGRARKSKPLSDDDIAPKSNDSSRYRGEVLVD